MTIDEVDAEPKGHMDLVRCIAFSKDGSLVASGLYHKTVRIWNVTTCEVEAELKGHTDLVISVAFSQDGSQVVSGSLDQTVWIWNTITGELKAELQGHTGWVMSVAFSQDGSQVVSGSEDKTVRIWNATTGEVEAELKGHRGMVVYVAFSQDGSQVVPGSDYETVQICNTVTGKLQSLTTTTTLLDTSVINNVGLGKEGCHINISYPEQPAFSIHGPLSISDDRQWILGACHDCWIPSYYCDFISSSFSGDRVCFGYTSGDVIIFDMKVAP